MSERQCDLAAAGEREGALLRALEGGGQRAVVEVRGDPLARVELVERRALRLGEEQRIAVDHRRRVARLQLRLLGAQEGELGQREERVGRKVLRERGRVQLRERGVGLVVVGLQQVVAAQLVQREVARPLIGERAPRQVALNLARIGGPDADGSRAAGQQACHRQRSERSNQVSRASHGEAH